MESVGGLPVLCKELEAAFPNDGWMVTGLTLVNVKGA